MLVFNRNELGGDFVPDGVPVVRNRGRVIAVLCACGPFARQRGKLRPLCSDAGGDEVWAEAGVHAQRTEEECFLSRRPAVRWWVEQRLIRLLWMLGHASEVMEHGGCVGDEVLDKIHLALVDGQVICIWHDVE